MPNLKTSTTTLGCPDWDLATIVRNVSAYGYDAVDFRGLKEDVDITRTPEFTAELANTKRMLADANLSVSAISSSISVCVPEAEDDNLEEARRTIPIAIELGAPDVRVFGGGDTETHSKEALAGFGATTVEKILALDGASALRWCFETHDHWTASADTQLLVEAVPSENFGVLWDVHHTIRVGGEAPESSYAVFGPQVFNTHFKDSVQDGDESRYVLLGEGDLPMAEGVRVLVQGGYEGFLTLEHEKRWHPELPEPEVTFPHSLKWFREALEKCD